MKRITVIFTVMVVLLLTSCRQDPQIEFTLNSALDTIEINETWVDTGASFDVDGSTTIIYTQTVIDTSTLGTKEVVYTHTVDGDVYQIKRFITVTDQTPPVLTLVVGIDTIKQHSSWTDEGCIATDNSNESLTCETDDEVDTSTVGTYIITYVAIDASLNEATITRIVNVIE